MGGGGGRGGAFVGRSAEELRKQIRRAEVSTTEAAFEADLAHLLGELLGAYNGRDIDTVRDRLDDLKHALEGTIDGAFDQMFGGSVAKHTYVDGLSDIDSLLIINETGLEGASPQTVLVRMQRIIGERLRSEAVVDHGRMAVTISYADGMVIQLLPAIKIADGQLRVPSSRRDGWSTIDPIAFQEALTRRNQQCGNRLVPTIKLAKAIIGQLPQAQRLSGYHIESLAIAAFRDYAGDKTTTAMLPAFFERARELVLSPIRDRTGQSIHVDDYLGSAGSDARVERSHLLGRLARRMRNASAAGSMAQWRAMFGFDR